jgi:rubrerythrin
MCDPVSATMGAISVAQGAAGASAARKQYKAQAEYNRKLGLHRNAEYYRQVAYQEELAQWQADRYNSLADSAEDSASGQYAALLDRVEQTKNATLQQIKKASMQARQGSSFVRAAAAETGTIGNSVRLAQQQYELAEARVSQASFTNLRNKLKQSQMNMYAIQAQTQNRINAALPAPMAPINPAAPVQSVARPSMAPYMVQAGAGVINAAAHHQTIEALNPTPASTVAPTGTNTEISNYLSTPFQPVDTSFNIGAG